MEHDSPDLAELQAEFTEDTHVQAVNQVLQRVDPETLRQIYRGTGSRAYDPMRMLAVALYCILIGMASPARWFKQFRDSRPCQLLGRGITPSRSVCYEFRDRCGKCIDELHQQIIASAINDDLIDPGEGCLDGTFVAAAASRHHILNLKQLNRRLAMLKRVIRTFDDPQQTASAKPAEAIPYWVAKTTDGRIEQLERYRSAKRRILEQIDQNRQRPKAYQRDEDRITIAPADIDAVIGKDKHKVVRPLYNIQYMSDAESDVILSFDVFAQNNDTGLLAPMIDCTHEVLPHLLDAVHADAGYCSVLELHDCQERGVELFTPVADRSAVKRNESQDGGEQIPAIEFQFEVHSGTMTCPAGHQMRRVSRTNTPRADGRRVVELRFEQNESACQACQLSGSCLGKNSCRRTVRRLEEQHLLDAQKKKMDSEAGRRSNKIRKSQVERRFADSKSHRDATKLHGRGLSRAKPEIGLLVVAQNALTLYNLVKRKLPPPN